MVTKKIFVKGVGVTAIASILLLSGCSGGPLSTREKGAGIGALGGAAAGGIIGAAVRRPAAGALIGDQLQGHENTSYQQQQQINRNQAEINRNRQDIQRLQRQTGEY